jgi:hypothetical protein
MGGGGIYLRRSDDGAPGGVQCKRGRKNQAWCNFCRARMQRNWIFSNSAGGKADPSRSANALHFVLKNDLKRHAHTLLGDAGMVCFCECSTFRSTTRFNKGQTKLH